MRKVILLITGTVIYYFIAVLTLFILTLLFNDSFENVWLSAIPVTIFAELLLLAWYLLDKHKKRTK